MNKRSNTPIALIAAVAMSCAGCATGPSKSGEGNTAEAQLLRTDAAFSKRSVEVGAAQAFYEYFAEDGQVLPAKGDPVAGRSAVRDRLAKLKGVLIWKPERAEAARSGDFGYTWGRSEYRETAKDGSLSTSRGKYLSVWRKQADGSWKVIMDIGNDEP
jgi:ketosteroid isomerase-like protein